MNNKRNNKSSRSDKVVSIKRKQKKPQALISKILFFLVVLFLAVILFFYVKDIIRSALVEVKPVQSGVFENKLDAEFIIVRQEEVVSAPNHGRLEKNCGDGEKVPKDAVIAYFYVVKGTSLQEEIRIPIKAPCAGIVSFQPDGFESIGNPEVWKQLDFDKLGELKAKLIQKNISVKKSQNENNLSAGQDILKIMDNLSPSYLYFEKDKKDVTAEFQAGQYLDISIEELDNLRINGKITDIFQTDDKIRLFIQIPSLSALQTMRLIKGQLVVEQFSGVIVPKKALNVREDKKGVFLFKNGHALWQEVNVIAEIEEQVILEGIKEGDWIITTPGLIKNGQKVFSSHH